MTILRTSRTKLTFGLEQCWPYNKEKLNELLIYLDRRTVTKVAPAECSEGYLNWVVQRKKELYVPARKVRNVIIDYKCKSFQMSCRWTTSVIRPSYEMKTLVCWKSVALNKVQKSKSALSNNYNLIGRAPHFLASNSASLIDCFNKKQRSHLIHFRIRQH